MPAELHLSADVSDPQWVLENAYARIEFAPREGRLVSWCDKRTAIEVLPEGMGFGVPEPVGDFAVQALPDDDTGVGLMALALTPSGQSLQVVLTLGHEGVALDVDTRAQYRRLKTTGTATPTLRFPVGSVRGRADGGAYAYDRVDRAGIAVHPHPDHAVGCAEEGHGWRVQPRGAPVTVPRWTRHLRVRLEPLSGLPTVDACGPLGAMAVLDDALLLHALQAGAVRIDYLGRDGATLSATVNLYPEQPYRLPLDPANPPAALAWVVEGRPWVTWERGREWPVPGVAEGFDGPAVSWSGATDDIWLVLAQVPGWGSAAFNALAIAASREGDVAGAQRRLEHALGFDAEDVLTWWGKAMHERDDEESPALLNAMYLAPMEPLLRVETFLRKPVAEGFAQDTLLTPLAERPIWVIEAVGELLRWGRRADASRLLDELLRHREEPRHRVIMAGLALQTKGMEAQAAEHLRHVATWPEAGTDHDEIALVFQRVAERFPDRAAK